MRNSKARKTLLGVLAACALLSACGGGDESAKAEEKGGNGDKAEEVDEVAGGGTARSTGTSDVVVQMTGLLLIVPPNRAGGPVHVYQPKAPRVGRHSPLLGFVIPREHAMPAGFCQKVNAQVNPQEICYVDLSEWTLQPFGNGGTTTTPTSISPVSASGLVDVTHLSGGGYKAFPPRAHAKSHPRITFLSGGLVDNAACKLAEWSYQPVNQQGVPQGSPQRARLSNVVVWAMTGLASPELVFSRQGSQDVRVPLPPGETRLLLAHIPTGELRHLPPAQARRVNTSTTAAHFHPMYDLLSRSTNVTDSLPHVSAHRIIPTLVRGDTVPCSIQLATGGIEKAGRRSMATYACIPTWGGGS